MNKFYKVLADFLEPEKASIVNKYILEFWITLLQFPIV